MCRFRLQTRRAVFKSFFFVLTVLLTPELLAQDGNNADNEPTARLDEIHAQQVKKAVDLRPAKPTAAEKYFARIGNAIQRSPIRVGVAGLGPGAGITAASLLEWESPGDQVRAKLWGRSTLDGFYAVGTGVELPHVGGRDLSFALGSSHRDAPQLNYYGPGPNSSIANRTDFRREDTLFEFRVRFSPRRNLESSCLVGELLLNVGPGTNKSLATTQSVFGPAQAPGIDVQSNFLTGGCSAEIDLRDSPRNPHQGTYAAAGYYRYYAQDHDQFSFNRLYAVAEHYIPFFNLKRAIAMRARTELSFHAEDQVVPFYLQPTLGSDEYLRGFRRYRFYDENSMALTAEYRWEANALFDMVLFFDSGEVFPRPGKFSLSEVAASPGFGLRFKNPRRVFARIDTGFSKEGFQIWVRTADFF